MIDGRDELACIAQAATLSDGASLPVHCPRLHAKGPQNNSHHVQPLICIVFHKDDHYLKSVLRHIPRSKGDYASAQHRIAASRHRLRVLAPIISIISPSVCLSCTVFFFEWRLFVSRTLHGRRRYTFISDPSVLQIVAVWSFCGLAPLRPTMPTVSSFRRR